ncbi:type I secretion system permease/ATPase [Endozoicomonas ascidiicola]|uniref:type I secretion system permease/ATPase n=1 Tax=Endozoicomonas ascidiicola TaxID=1698521 RepID=UPI00083131B7|nr:ATP-binding cassette domain-containing protein [Endozoicomonas ascidiicola]
MQSITEFKSLIFRTIGYSAVVNLLMLTVPIYSLQLFSRVLVSYSVDTLVMLTLIAVFLLLIMMVVDLSRNRLLAQAGMIYCEVATPIAMMADIQHSRQREKQSFTRHLHNIRSVFSAGTLHNLFDAPWSPLFIGVIFLIHPLLGWIVTFGSLLLIAMSFILVVITNRHTHRQPEEAINTNQQSDEFIHKSDALISMGMATRLVNRWTEKQYQDLNNQDHLTAKTQAIQSISKGLRLLLQLSIMAVTVWLVLQSEVMPGAIIAASIISARALAPVEQSITSWNNWLRAWHSYQLIQDLLKTDPDSSSSVALEKPTGALEARGIYYSPRTTASEPLLKSITCRFESGKAYALIGPSGSGKTTLARLLSGIETPSAGSITLQGMEMSVWIDKGLGEYLGYLPQDIQLLSASFAENISRFNNEDQNKLTSAARIVGIHDLIQSFDKGYDTLIGEGGIPLSGGQLQRVGLARAVYGAPHLLILDEPNAFLDADSENRLLQLIDSARKSGAIVITITHKLSLLNHFDEVLVLQHGQLVRQVESLEFIKEQSRFRQKTKPAVSGQQEAV